MHLLGLLLLSLPSCATAASLTLHLPPTVLHPAGLPPSTHATLSTLSRHHSAPLSALHTFVFRNVTPGSYLADVHCPTYGFRPLRIDVLPPRGEVEGPDEGAAERETVRAWDTFRGNEWANKGEEATPVRVGSGGGGEADYGFEVKSLGGKVYFVERPSFSILSILKNPMILMGLVSMVIFIGMPKLVDSMDPETKAEFEASQRNSPLNAVLGGGGGGGSGSGAHQQQSPLGNFDMAAYLAGSGKKDAGGAGNPAGGQREPVRRR
ncbi:hypothetical protein E4U41_002758 [Claviceps citrina]|nr:hypothetical protein E4U41_002758 [Claviceps citrina]